MELKNNKPDERVFMQTVPQSESPTQQLVCSHCTNKQVTTPTAARGAESLKTGADARGEQLADAERFGKDKSLHDWKQKQM